MKQFFKLKSYLRPYRKRILSVLIFALLESFGTVIGTYFIGRAVDAVPGKGFIDLKMFVIYLAILLVIFLSTSTCQWLNMTGANKIASSLARDLRKKAFDLLQKLPVSFFDTHPHGDILSHFTNDLDTITDAFSLGIVYLFTGILIVISSIVVMFMLNILLALTVLIITPLCILVAGLITRLCQRSFQQQQQAIGDLSAYVSEYIGNQKVVKVFGREEEEKEQFEIKAEKLKKAATKAVFISAMNNPGTRFVNYFCYITVGLIGSFLVVKGHITVGILSSFLIYSNQFFKPINSISGITTQLQTAAAAIGRVFELLEQPTEEETATSKTEMSDCKGEVEFSHVWFGYTEDRPVIRDFSFKAKPGQMIALVGQTGCGKTTLINLLMRFYDVNKGSISVDGKDIREISRDDLRNRFGMVLQDTWLFSGTIAENIAFGKKGATREEIVAAAKEAYADGFISRLPQGYDTPVQADMLSQGEQQLITIARAILEGANMLILDEATSSVDTLTEQRIQKAVQELTRGKTSFVIAHRLSTIRAADQILVMDGGKIAEMGTHEELLKAGGLYKELYQKSHV